MKNIAVCVLLAVAVASAFAAVQRKQLNGPPGEFARYDIPSPTAGGVASSMREYIVGVDSPTVLADDGSATWTHKIAIDSHTEFAFSVFSPIEDKLTLSLVNSKGHTVRNLAAHGEKTFIPAGDSGENSLITGTTYTFVLPYTGEWTLTLTTDASVIADKSLFKGAYAAEHTHYALLHVWTDSNDAEFTHLNTYNLVEGQEIGLVTRMYSELKHPSLAIGEVPVALQDTITEAKLDVTFPDGTQTSKAMSDNGLNFDGAENDGVYGATVTATQAGSYTLRADLSGTNSVGDFARSTEHIVNVVPKSLTFTGTATAAYDSTHERLTFQIAVANKQVSSDSKTPTYRAYAQVWGKDATTGKDVAVCWTSAIVDVMAVGSASVVELEADAKWVSAVSAAAPFELRNVYVQEMTSFVPIDSVASVPVTGPSTLHAKQLTKTMLHLNSTGYNGEITRQMRVGVMPAELRYHQLKHAQRKASDNSTAGDATLIMMHGYCAEGNPWTASEDDFTGAQFFFLSDEPVNVGHDEYSQSLIEWAQTNNFVPFSLIGHSQGGAVGVHTMNFYWSGLDAHAPSAADDECRKIQSLATPYRGTKASGAVADLFKSFAGCGASQDMSTDGAVLWLAGISVDAMQQSNRYATEYAKSGLFGGNCNAAMNLVLDKKNDGVTESSRADLDYGQLIGGFFQGECHTDGMEWPASPLNHDRNEEMNAAACR